MNIKGHFIESHQQVILLATGSKFFAGGRIQKVSTAQTDSVSLTRTVSYKPKESD